MVDIALSFQAREFQPALYATNRHLLTILGVFSRDKTKYIGAAGALLTYSSKL